MMCGDKACKLNSTQVNVQKKKKKRYLDLAFEDSSVVECLPSMYEILRSIFSTK